MLTMILVDIKFRLKLERLKLERQFELNIFWLDTGYFICYLDFWLAIKITTLLMGFIKSVGLCSNI